MSEIRVLVVENSAQTAKVISAILNGDRDIIVVGVAKDGLEAIKLVPQLKPDVITMDIKMPRMDGLETTKQIMAYSPTPILILSSSAVLREKDLVFKAMSYGALDIMEKHSFEKEEDVDEKAKEKLISNIKLLSRAKVISHPLAKYEKTARKALHLPEGAEHETRRRIVGIVASTGGPQTLAVILKAIPNDFDVPIVVVQHISAGFTDGLVDWLNRETKLKVALAKNQEKLEPGIVYIAPAELQMRIVHPGQKIELANGAPVDGQCPSGTVLLESLAEAYGRGALGVILTGMGEDGARGIKAIFDAGGYTIAQNMESCVVFGMPKAAIEMAAVNDVLSPHDIADRIIKWGGPLKTTHLRC